MGLRRRARELALTALFEEEFHDLSWSRLRARVEEDGEVRPELEEFLKALFDSYAAHKELVDAEIEKRSSHWKLTRMAIVDRNILRLGLTEIYYMPDIPKSVTINEYLEIAKKYGTEESSGFINGILDRFDKPTP